MSTTISQLLKLQTDVLDRLNTLERNYKKDGSARRTKIYFEKRIEAIEELRQQYQNQHRGLVSSDLPDAHDYYTGNNYDKFDERYLDVISLIQGEFHRVFPPVLPQPTQIQQNNDRQIQQQPLAVRLPKIPLPTFSGKYIDWPVFHDSFNRLVHTNVNLANVEKFHHLKSALPENFDSDIRDIPLTNENYTNAYELLVSRYNNKRVLFTHYMNLLSNQPIISVENSLKIKQLLDTSRSCVNALQQLQLPVDQCSQILVHFLITKLPRESHQFWEQELGNSTVIPDFKRFSEFLDVRFRTLEAIEFKSGVSQQSFYTISTPESNSSKQSNSKSSKIPKSVNSAITTKAEKTKSLHCALCSDAHIIRHCPKFLSMDCFERKTTVDRTKLCVNCLSGSHTTNKCSSLKNCLQCGKRHHTLLHFPIANTSNSNANSNATATLQPTQSMNNIVQNHITNQTTLVPYKSNTATLSSEVLLPTAVLKVHTPDGRIVLLRALLDQGSQGALITERATQTLNLHRIPMMSTISLPNGQHTKAKYAASITIQSCVDDECKFDVIACIVKNTTNNLPTKTINFLDWPHLQNIPLADPSFNRSRKIDLLLGADVLARILLPGLVKGSPNEPIAQQTAFGWIVSGEILEKEAHELTFNCSHIAVSLDQLVQRFHEIENVPEEQQHTSEEEWCVEHFKKTHVRQPNGKYLVRLPFKTLFDPSQTVGKSKQMALNRFYSLERKFLRDPELAVQYSSVIREYFNLNQIKPVTTNESQHIQYNSSNAPSQTCYTLPHHAVMKLSSTTTKCRVVFDASAKSANGRSLNDILCTGPALQNDLAAVLMNWRIHRYVFTADMEKMYRCIDVHEDDSQFQRMIWRDENGELKDFRLITVTFGTGPAPYIAIQILHQLADDEAERYPLAAPVIKSNAYVDDVFTGQNTIEQTIELRDQVIGILDSAGFKLRKWASNCPKILNEIPTEYHSVDSSLQLTDDASIKTLGIHWNPTSDCFHYEINFNIEKTNITKRIVLSTTARIFDPMGLIGPVIVKAKIFIKKLWACDIGWDDSIPTDLINEWLAFLHELTDLNKIRIPRWIQFDSNSILKCELHAFCDGSKLAYAATIYLRLQTADKQFHSNIMVAKNRITPSKPELCIPRIELCAALLNVRLVKWVLTHIQINKTNLQIYYWSDATIVLSWIRGNKNRWPVFVANRINKIHALSKIDQWHHVSTNDNPADCLSRGVSPSQLSKHDLYWHGPAWLCDEQTKWPTSDWSFLEDNTNDGSNPQIHALQKCNVSEFSYIHRFSSYTTLCRVTAYVLRFVYKQFPNLNTAENVQGYLTAGEIYNSLLFLVRMTQAECFSEEINALKSKRQIATNSKLISLSPFLDNNNILRVYGRLKHAPLPYNQKHPMILPRSHHFTILLINFAHLSTEHGLPSLTAAFIRKRFCIIHAKRMIQLQLKKCIKCFRQKPITQTQQMGNLPTQRVTPSRPFAATGVDYTGAIELRSSRYRGNTTYKGYIAVFICLATKAIHLEAVTGMDTKSFLQAFQRFIGRRGMCFDVYSDNGTNFVGADRELQKNMKKFNESFEADVLSKLTIHGIRWHFTPPYAPNFGGLWEANVKSVKYHLKRMIDGTRFTYEELSTVLVRIESCLNSRPLCPLSADPDEINVLTPGHFLCGDSLLAPPEPMVNGDSLHSRYLMIQRVYQQFWKFWSSDWLSHLQSRPKWHRPTMNLKIDEVVLIRDDNLPPNQWLLGRIIEIHPGDDGLVRVVTLKTKNGNFKRSISKICRLPMDIDDTESTQV